MLMRLIDSALLSLPLSTIVFSFVSVCMRSSRLGFFNWVLAFIANWIIATLASTIFGFEAIVMPLLLVSAIVSYFSVRMLRTA